MIINSQKIDWLEFPHAMLSNVTHPVIMIDIFWTCDQNWLTPKCHKFTWDLNMVIVENKKTFDQ